MISCRSGTRRRACAPRASFSMWRSRTPGPHAEEVRRAVSKHTRAATSAWCVLRGSAHRGFAPQDEGAVLTVGSAALGDGEVVALRRARIELPRSADLLRRVLDHLLPLGDPA